MTFTAEAIFGVLLAIIGTLLGLLYKKIGEERKEDNDRMTQIEHITNERIAELEGDNKGTVERIHSVETNYNAKFAEVNRNVIQTSATMERSLGALRTEMIEILKDIQINCATTNHGRE